MMCGRIGAVLLAVAVIGASASTSDAGWGHRHHAHYAPAYYPSYGAPAYYAPASFAAAPMAVMPSAFAAPASFYAPASFVASPTAYYGATNFVASPSAFYAPMSFAATPTTLVVPANSSAAQIKALRFEQLPEDDTQPKERTDIGPTNDKLRELSGRLDVLTEKVNGLVANQQTTIDKLIDRLNAPPPTYHQELMQRIERLEIRMGAVETGATEFQKKVLSGLEAINKEVSGLKNRAEPSSGGDGKPMGDAGEPPPQPMPAENQGAKAS